MNIIHCFLLQLKLSKLFAWTFRVVLLMKQTGVLAYFYHQSECQFSGFADFFMHFIADQTKRGRTKNKQLGLGMITF